MIGMLISIQSEAALKLAATAVDNGIVLDDEFTLNGKDDLQTSQTGQLNKPVTVLWRDNAIGILQDVGAE